MPSLALRYGFYHILTLVIQVIIILLHFFILNPLHFQVFIIVRNLLFLFPSTVTFEVAIAPKYVGHEFLIVYVLFLVFLSSNILILEITILVFVPIIHFERFLAIFIDLLFHKERLLIQNVFFL